jgi:UDP-glucose:(heptosyl)LPS alpha-1,3-glucosyltransferase
MKLLLIARPLGPHGGVERATAGLVGALVAAGHEVSLASPGGCASLPGVRPQPLVLPPGPAVVRLLVRAAATRWLARRHRWDLVQSHERTLGQHVYRAGEGCHRAYLRATGPTGGRGLYHRVVLALERRLFATTPAVVAIARRGYREIRELYRVDPGRLAVIYNGVDLDRFHPRLRERERPRARAEAGIAPEAWMLLFVGSGFERKGLATAIEALALSEDRRATLVVIGRGHAAPYRALAARLGVADRVVWLGLRSDVERWYAAADVCVLPSRYEPFGNVHLEALASGTPVVASTEAGGSEIIRPGLNGAVVDPRDPRAVAAAIAELREGGPRGGRCEAARASAEPFTYEAQALAFQRLWRALLQGRPNPGAAVENPAAGP